MILGIQGGRGSFNEEAARDWFKRVGTEDYEIRYLYTTEQVLAALRAGRIDRGLFAVRNSLGGEVQESAQAMASHKFTVLDEFSIPVSHSLLIRSDAELPEVTTVMAHPQALAQCRHTLAKQYPSLQLTSGEGELIDPAKVAERMAAHKLPKNVATLGSQRLADIYNLKLAANNLQDTKHNYTTFLLVSR